MQFGFFSVQDYHPELGIAPAEYFDRLLERMVAADRLGYHSFWLAEHHFHNYGLNPAPPVVLGAAARLTERLRLGVAVSQIPFHNPLRLAEDYALVDLLSHGRLNFGAGSGYLQHEFDGFGVPFEEKAARLDEGLVIIRRAWSGERFSLRGRFHQVQDVQLQVRPVQQPHPPIWVATLHAENAYRIGRNGFPLLGIPYVTVKRLADIAPVIERYKEGLAEAGLDPASVPVTMALHTYVAETDEAAEQAARACLDRYVLTRLFARHDVLWEELRERQLIAVGSPTTVAAAVATLRDAGATEVPLLMDFGRLPHERVLASMELFACEVAPRFAGAAASPAART
jgi:alkanesulfonate monooxygenase SsuD/methylene tetrahydromethanopterin reductase-like flavin-dependent oxidoreductase (luciferase family)